MNAVEHPLDPEELMAYRDGELPPERASVVQSHVAACAACQALSSDLERVSRDLASWRIENAPGTLRAMSAMSEAPVDKSFRPRWFPAWAFYSVSGLAVGGSLVVLLLPVQSSWMSMGKERAPQVFASEPANAPVSAGRPSVATEAPEAVSTFLSGVPTRGSTVAQGQSTQPQRSAPRIVRTATLHLVAQDFDAARTSLTRIVADMGGFVGSLDVTGVPPSPRVLKATIRIPGAQLDGALTSLKAIGNVIAESQSADDVTEQALDLEARIANGRHTEKRLNDLLQKRTGDLSDVLAAEREIARVREEIERLDAQRQNLENRVTYATVSVQIAEPGKSTLSLGPLPLSARIRNAFVDGFRTMFVSVVEVSIVSLQILPLLIFWGVLIAGPIYFFTRRASRSASGMGRTGP